ncbi:MAG: hypothetical protein ABFS41_10495 [Myxococcota bacterium]
MIEQRRWSRDAAVPIFAGATWLWFAASFGLVGFLFSLISPTTSSFSPC